MIRDAEVGDWPAIADLGERLIAKSVYADVAPLDRQSALRVYGHTISSAMGFAMVSDNDGIDGILLGVVDQLWWSKERYASDLVFYCENGRAGLPLLRAFVRWAWSIPRVVEVSCAQSSGMKNAQALYKRAGFEQVGGLWNLRRDVG